MENTSDLGSFSATRTPISSHCSFFRPSIMEKQGPAAGKPKMSMTLPLTILATGRMASGLFLLASPRMVGALSSLPHGPSSSVLGHLVGARDLALGVLLYTADKGEQAAKVNQIISKYLTKYLIGMLI